MVSDSDFRDQDLLPGGRVSGVLQRPEPVFPDSAKIHRPLLVAAFSGLGFAVPGFVLRVSVSGFGVRFRCRVSGFGFRVVRFRVSGVMFHVSGFSLRDSCFVCQVSGARFRVSDFMFRISGLRFRVSGSRFRVSGVRFRVSVPGFG